MQNILFNAIVLIVICSSCTTTYYYQLVDTTSKNMEKVEGTYVSENDEVAISYKLWADYGNTGFTITNKTDQHLFINMKLSHRIVNGIALTYYQGRTSSSSASAGLAVRSVNNDIVAAVSEKETVTFNEMEIITIPPKSSKYLYDGGKLVYRMYSYCELPKYPSSSKEETLSFKKDDSPMEIRNLISYKIGQEATTYKSIEDSYWVSGVTNYRSGKFIGARSVKDCRGDTERLSYYKWYSPSRFYVRYTY